MAACASTSAQADKGKDSAPFSDLAKVEKEILTGLDDHSRAYVEARLGGAYAVGRLDRNFYEEWKEGQVGFVIDRTRPFLPRLNQVVDERNMLVYGSNIWVEGVSTDGLTDTGNSNVNLSGIIFLVAGTKRYETALGGSRTVRHIVAVDTKISDRAIRRIIEPRGYRLWTDKGGATTIAAFSRKSGTTVTLRLPNGETVRVRSTSLSEADREWLKDKH
jgi:hypothetical protein